MTEYHRIDKQLRGVAARLTGDLHLQKDLLQEMSLHLIQMEADRPGQTPSWYLQSCQFRARNYLLSGRSVDSLKRGNNLVAFAQGDEDRDDRAPVCPDAADPIDLHCELVTRDIVDLMVPRLTDLQQQILLLLLHGFGVREIGRELRVSHPAVSKHRKKIAASVATLLVDVRCPRYKNDQEDNHDNH